MRHVLERKFSLTGTKQKTIYEYHKVNFAREKVQNNTLITLYAQPTCYSFKDCQSCMNHEGAEFKVRCMSQLSTNVERITFCSFLLVHLVSHVEPLLHGS